MKAAACDDYQRLILTERNREGGLSYSFRRCRGQVDRYWNHQTRAGVCANKRRRDRRGRQKPYIALASP